MANRTIDIFVYQKKDNSGQTKYYAAVDQHDHAFDMNEKGTISWQVVHKNKSDWSFDYSVSGVEPIEFTSGKSNFTVKTRKLKVYEVKNDHTSEGEFAYIIRLINSAGIQAESDPTITNRNIQYMKKAKAPVARKRTARRKKKEKKTRKSR